jgi:hypothetical protein
MGRTEPTFAAGEYYRAFSAVAPRVTAGQRAIIRAHLNAPSRTATAAELARAVGYRDHRGVNLQYGQLAGWICDQLRAEYPENLHVLAAPYQPPSGDLQLTLRPAVVEALRTLGWFGDVLAPADRGVVSSLSELGALEGIPYERLSTDYTRDPELRARKIAEALRRNRDGRLRCEVPGCGFDFEEVYGEIGHGFAHVHHLKPLTERASPAVTELADLAVVCANCHAMIHVGGACRRCRIWLGSAVEA